jgi:hypothetical protein
MAHLRAKPQFENSVGISTREIWCGDVDRDWLND